MYKKKVYVLIYLSMVLPVLLSSGALDRYTIPQQQSKQMVQPKAIVNESVYHDFKKQIQDYTPERKEDMKAYYRKKMKEAVGARNFDAASHYERLIGILNSSK